MLTSLSIRNIVLIDRADIEFDAGLGALTGETGAGKSIILDALGLATGQRADKALVRGDDTATATAMFALADDHPARAILDEGGFALDGGELILRRTLNADGRSRAFVNDEPASVGLLKQIGESLVEVHGQHDGRGLLDPRTHRGLLDAYGGHDKQIGAVRAAYDTLADARKKAEALEESRGRAEAERDYLEHAAAELDRLDPQTGEEQKLADERAFLGAAEKSLSDLQEASEALTGGQGMEDRLNHALASLERIVAKLPEGEEDETGPGAAIRRATAALERAVIEAGEARNAVEDAARTFEFEPDRLEKVEERLFALRAAARKHQVEVDDLPSLRKDITEKLALIEDSGAAAANAEKALKEAAEHYDAAAAALTRAREAAAKKLDKAVAKELPPLKLDKATFATRIDPAERDGADGLDRIRFEASTNPGSKPGPLDQIASGGELSRFSLAIKAALAETNAIATMIFDEVDQGVGGAVADAVGRRLKALSETGQVIVVTHSPQVAARADHHWRIEKKDAKGATLTSVTPLDDAERDEEVARMLAGAEITDEARAAARKLRAADA